MSDGKICALPLGGYVKFFGDASGASNASDLADKMSEQERRSCFHFKPVWQRMLVVFAGPGINLLAAVLVFAFFYQIYGTSVTQPLIKSVAEGSAAAEAGLEPGDRILAINNRAVERFSEIGPEVRLHPGAEIIFSIERDGQTFAQPIRIGIQYFEDRFGNSYPYGVLGVTSPQAERVELGIFGALKEGIRETNTVIRTIFTTTGQIIVGVRSVKELGGPVRIATMTGEAANRGWQNLVYFLALISINLGIVNLLPIPVLDGGHLMFYFIEAIKGSPINKKAQEAGFVGGMALLLIFMVLVTLNDLQSIVL